MYSKKTSLPIAILFISSLLATGFMIGKQYDKISVESIAYAEAIIGLRFSDVERDSMITTLENQKQAYDLSRKTSIPNDIAPSLIFNPLPHGFTPDQKQNEYNWGLIDQTNLPDNENDIAFLPVTTLSILIKDKHLTSEKLTKLYISRIKAHGDTLQALITLLEASAIRTARAMDKEIAAGKYRGPLHGIPYGIKDLFAVKGTKTTWGAEPYRDQEIDETAEIVDRLNEAGAVLVAKFTLGALAMGDVWYGGVTKNPWNLRQGSSGSSAGSAATVGAGLVPFAIGTETLGSIVSPSTRNGVTGLRPTYGRVSKHGAMALSWSMDKIGPISRSALDNGIILSALNGKDAKDKSTIAAAFNYDATKPVNELKVGYLVDLFERAHENDKEVLEVMKGLGIALQPLQLKTSVEPGAMRIMLLAEGAAAFDELTRLDQDDLLVAQHKNAWPNLFRAARFIPAVEYIQASRLRSMLIEEVHELFKDYDVIITPSFAGSQLLITNLTGHPALVMPNGFTADGSPTSITFLANLFDEEKLIMLGRAYQDATVWNKRRPAYFDN
ncbi:amidase [Anditalea andensis]|uniref:Amidase n=1 Tax=Anditalea andensis TaxID=1048983 RepID=A0A074LIQ4_9BACT|nr:amidase [Anditalea andensis]KEO73652.1 amidase [Anditalea andensis]